MKTKLEIVSDWLPRYTGVPVDEIRDYILLTNFDEYVTRFADEFGVSVQGSNKPMQVVSNDDITMINFGMGSAMAATVMDLLVASSPKAVLLLGKCGSLKRKADVGDIILPIAAIRGEGTSNDYLAPEIPALPSFQLQRSLSSTIVKHELDYWTGSVYTTNRRVWEHDDTFREYLRTTRAIGIDMETATVFVAGFVNEIPRGALLLVSDQPMAPEGVKTAESDKQVSRKFVERHLHIGIEALTELKNSGESVKHLRYEEFLEPAP